MICTPKVRHIWRCISVTVVPFYISEPQGSFLCGLRCQPNGILIGKSVEKSKNAWYNELMGELICPIDRKLRRLIMRLDGFGLFVEDMARMIRFYRDVLGFEIKECEDTSNVYLVKDGTLFLLYGRKDFENMTHRKYEYIKGMNGHSEIALYVDTFEEVDTAYNNAIKNGATSVLEPELEPWGQRTCYIADPEGNLIEIGSWNKSYEEKDL